MKQKDLKLEDCSERKPFSVPQDYFENFASTMQTRLKAEGLMGDVMEDASTTKPLSPSFPSSPSDHTNTKSSGNTIRLWTRRLRNTAAIAALVVASFYFGTQLYHHNTSPAQTLTASTQEGEMIDGLTSEEWLECDEADIAEVYYTAADNQY